MIALLFLLVLPLSQAHWAAAPKDEGAMTPIQLIRHRGYPAEEHRVTTRDGWILVLHRIPGDRYGCRGGRPVLLQHAPLLSSYDFLSPQRNLSLSYTLADAGYDVWVSNSRSNVFSKFHKRFNSSDPRFWNFSLDEMGAFDYPAIIDYILKKSRRKQLHVVGHAQGALTFFMSTIASPSIHRKVLHFFGLAPALGTQAAGANLLKVANSLPPEMLATFPTSPFAPIFFPFCRDPANKVICAALIASMGPLDIDPARLPTFISHFPGGTSNKLFLHWQQLAAINTTRAFDYGEEGNKAKYGTPTPPVYKFSRYRVPSTMFYSAADNLIDTTSIKQGMAVVPRHVFAGATNLTGFGHFDFLWGSKAKKEIYSKILKEMKRCERK